MPVLPALAHRAFCPSILEVALTARTLDTSHQMHIDRGKWGSEGVFPVLYSERAKVGYKVTQRVQRG